MTKVDFLLECLDYKEIIQSAELAFDFHKGQYRKYTGRPYIIHPAKVYKIVAQENVYMLMNADKMRNYIDMCCAAILHDTLEDTDISEKEIVTVSNEHVLNLVKQLTSVLKHAGNRERRKALDRERLKNASWEAKVIKLADRIANLNDMITDAPHYPDCLSFLPKYLDESQQLLDESLRKTHDKLEYILQVAINEGRRL